MNEYFTSLSSAASQPLYYPPFKKRNHGHYYLYQPHRYVTSAGENNGNTVEAVQNSEEPQGTQMSALYPEILAIIFSYLPLQDKGRACQVCRKWYNTIYQYKSLWKNIEAKIHLSNNSYSNKIIMKNIIKSIVKRNITRIQILSTNNNNINLLFKNNYMIRSLNLSGLYNLNDNIILNLIIVNVNLNKFNHLTHLNLSLCKLLTDNSLMYICKFMNRLTDLNVSGCNSISNNSLLVIYKHLSELKHLNLKSLWLINDIGIGYLCGVGVDLEEEEDSKDISFMIPRRGGVSHSRLNSSTSSSNNLNELINRIDSSNSRSSGVQTGDDNSNRNETQERSNAEGAPSNVDNNSSNSNLSVNPLVKSLPRKYLTSHLETLILQDCQRITDESIKIISTSMTSLKHLNLSFCINVSDNCFKYINKMPHLNELILRSCNITDTGIEYLNSNLDNLTTLDLCFCESITDRTLQHLCVYILNLKHLYLSHCHISDTGLSRISKTLFNLENLYLGQCHSITDASIIQFIQSSALSSEPSADHSRSDSELSRRNESNGRLCSSRPDSERRLKYIDVYGCKLINYNVLLNALAQSNSTIEINFGL
ncbi:F-box/LRR-repeat protein 14 [Diaphorina citri]|uniref:F-box/LRR-repeat protein 14 n=1 Tax=Diaphorina citri TaxID=121845 RepID=A0A3Q0IT99_DIACI|nr:F-box/LRR-repeat protein 14 [Diaphorina citri]